MAITIKNISNGMVQTSQLPIVAAVPTFKALVIKNMRFVNSGPNPATLNVFFKATSSGDPHRILPKDVVIAPGAMLVDDDELTLEAGNLVEAIVSGTTPAVDYVISGIERDA